MWSRFKGFLAHLRYEHSSPGRLAASVFLGLFLGIVPLYGVQTPLCLLVATGLRLNRLTVVGAAQISNPLFAPFLIAAGIALGDWLRYGRLHELDLDQARGLTGLWWLGGEVTDLFLSCLLGDTLIAVVVGVLGAAATYAWRVRADTASSARPGADVLGDGPE
ncbi:MAG: DUF2062 domain-containing protein [Myxococcales bacterium]|nr:DUF2062 domain-containing protein [Myxococcales bacterium]